MDLGTKRQSQNDIAKNPNTKNAHPNPKTPNPKHINHWHFIHWRFVGGIQTGHRLVFDRGFIDVL